MNDNSVSDKVMQCQWPLLVLPAQQNSFMGCLLGRAAHCTCLRQAGRDVWMGVVPITVSTCDEILTGRLTGQIAPIYSHQLDSCLDGMDSDAVGKF